jgi:hypothetical protein
VRAHLNIPQTGLLGQTLAQVILTERAETWVNLRRSETRRRIIAAIAHRLLHPAELPSATTTDPLPRLRWLLDQPNAGIALTQTGSLSQKFVQQSADRFGWGFTRPATDRGRPASGCTRAADGEQVAPRSASPRGPLVGMPSGREPGRRRGGAAPYPPFACGSDGLIRCPAWYAERSRARAATSDRHAARSAFQNVSDLIAD